MPQVQSQPGQIANGSFRLDEMHVDPATGDISGPGGREQVDPKVMAVLLVLARHPGELVTRSQLLEEIWPGGAIYDDTLTQAVYQLRQHLTAAGGGERFRKLVKTLPKRGYLLKASVIPDGHPLLPDHAKGHGSVPAASERHNRRRIWLLLAMLLALATAYWLNPGLPETDPSRRQVDELPPGNIAVLPFVNLEGAPGDDYLVAGIGDELRDQIGATPGLKVVGRRSSIHAQLSDEDTAEIGRQLGVGRLIEGRFSREDDRIFLSVELVDAITGFQLWSNSYDRQRLDLLSVQQELADDVLAQLLPGYVSEPLAAASAEQLASHELVLLARQYEHQLTDEQRVDENLLGRVIDLYRQAVEADPLSAEAHARLGRMLLYQGSVVESEPHILRALELDPNRAEAFTALGLYYWAVREVGISAAYRRAIELNPSDADTLSYYASWSWLQGNAARAVEYYQAALDIDPLNLVRYADLGYKLAFQNSSEEASELMERMLELFPTAAGYLAAARISEAMGKFDEAAGWAMQSHLLRPEDAEVNGQVAELLARLGDFELAAEFDPEPTPGLLFWHRRYQELVDLGEELVIDDPGDIDLRLLLAFAYSALGQHEQSIAQMESAGFPETVLAESRRASELHALLTYVGALQASGKADEARSMAGWAFDFNMEFQRTGTDDGWAARLSMACAQNVLGDRQASLDMLDSLTALQNIPPLPWLRDLACLQSLVNEPRYKAVVAEFESRVATQRARLPETLALHGIDWSELLDSLGID